MAKIQINKLAKAKGLDAKLAKAITTVYDTYEELAGAGVEDLVASVEGLDEKSAAAAIAFARVKVGAGTVMPPVTGEEIATSVETKEAPSGTTAVKKVLRRSGDLAKQLGLPEIRYMGCSYCRNDLDVIAEEEGIPVSQMTECPYCNAVFVQEIKVRCYSCGGQMTSDGRCLTCGAKRDDQFELKAMTIYVRRQQGTSGRVARVTAQGFLQDASLKTQIVATAKAEKWVEREEEGRPAEGTPFRRPTF